MKDSPANGWIGTPLLTNSEQMLNENDVPVYDLLECTGYSFNVALYPDLAVYLGDTYTPTMTSPISSINYRVIGDVVIPYDFIVPTGTYEEQALELLACHHRFMKNNTGDTFDPEVQHMVTNNQRVLSNNRHFIAHTQMEYQPNGDGTSEGQTLEILGYIEAYKATGKQEYLDYAELYWQAYIDHFYAGQAIPESAERFVCNWIINSKEPALTNYPVNASSPTQGGFKCVPLQFVNGAAQVPHGAPFYGEYLDVIALCHRGHMAWDAINGGTRVINDTVDWDDIYANYRLTTTVTDLTDSRAWIDWDSYLGTTTGYSVDWDTDSDTYDIEWMVAWTGDKIQVTAGSNDELWGGDIVESGLASTEYGKIQLVDATINGVYLVNFATRNPVADGGYLLARNETQHNRPIHTPLGDDVGNMGNAADAELWFIDCCYQLYDITGEEKYNNALQCVLFTSYEYKDIDAGDVYFRQTTDATTPFTDGISYDYSYPSVMDYTLGRDSDGYITIDTNESGDVTMEQQSVKYEVDSDSSCVTNFGGVGITGEKVSCLIQLYISSTDDEEISIMYTASTPLSASLDVVENVIPLSKFTLTADENGDSYLTASLSAVTNWGDVTYTEGFATVSTNTIKERDASIVDAVFTSDSSGFIIGFWLTDSGLVNPTSLTYKSDSATHLKISDDDDWTWYWDLPNTSDEWETIELVKANLTLSSYQGDHPDATEFPTSANYTTLSQMTIGTDIATGANFSYYCVNDAPATFSSDSSFSYTYAAVFSCSEAYNALLGTCYILDPVGSGLAYTKGLIPFSNNYTVGASQIGSWHGMPYPGYQSPMMYSLGFNEDDDTYLNNVVDFLYDSQQYYYNLFGELGPGASAYYWDRWDSLAYAYTEHDDGTTEGGPDTFTMYHWGDGHAWDTYQCRAFNWACRGIQVLMSDRKDVPDKLLAYCTNWAEWLIAFTQRTDNPDNLIPYSFPSDTAIVIDEMGSMDSSMCGLWLGGCAMLKLAGIEIDGLDDFMDLCVADMRNNLHVLDNNDDFTLSADHLMNGSWSYRVTETDENDVFYGFHSGEALRGLGLYLQVKKLT